jgi:cytokinesis protein
MSSDSDAPKSPASTGAMDDLLQKLRAAKPEARDQRDRRRRARLKDKHQVRVASGQKIPELGINVEDEAAKDSEGNEDTKNILSPTSDVTDTDAPAIATTSADADIADRAAAMLEGLQGGSSLNKDGSLSVRRRRESADTERQRRRNRRQQASSAKTDDEGGIMSPNTIPEEGGGDDSAMTNTVEGDEEEEMGKVVISPPSPEQKGRELPTPPPE